MTPEESSKRAKELRDKAHALKSPAQASDTLVGDTLEMLGGEVEGDPFKPTETGLSVDIGNGIKVDMNVAEFYNQHALDGAENLGGSLPMLSIVQPNSQGLLANSSRPNLGYFYYKPTQEQFEQIEVNITTISRSYYAKPMKPTDKDGKPNKPQFTQIVAGMITNDLPFVWFVKGMALRPLWDYAKEAGTYTRAKPFPIPMFGLNVVLSTHKEKTDFGDVYVPDFELNKANLAVTDLARLKILKEYQDYINPIVTDIITRRGNENTVSNGDIIDGVPLPPEPPREVIESGSDIY